MTAETVTGSIAQPQRRTCSSEKAQGNILPPHLATKAEKLAANRMVIAAVRRGDLVRPDLCTRCHIPWIGGRVVAHHEDYAKPLDVVWLCDACHIYRHREIRRSTFTRVCIVCGEEFGVPDLRSKICERKACYWELQRRRGEENNKRTRHKRIAAAWLVIQGRKS
jgi:hypothetical protein